MFVTSRAKNVLALRSVRNCDLILCKKQPTLLSGSLVIFRKPHENDCNRGLRGLWPNVQVPASNWPG